MMPKWKSILKSSQNRCSKMSGSDLAILQLFRYLRAFFDLVVLFYALPSLESG